MNKTIFKLRFYIFQARLIHKIKTLRFIISARGPRQAVSRFFGNRPVRDRKFGISDLFLALADYGGLSPFRMHAIVFLVYSLYLSFDREQFLPLSFYLSDGCIVCKEAEKGAPIYDMEPLENDNGLYTIVSSKIPALQFILLRFEELEDLELQGLIVDVVKKYCKIDEEIDPYTMIRVIFETE